ncbi:glycosyltransferase family 2 protein [Thozetella sp. PMI_491]|nr:glycosyltransferase family 2 protein [Thozetella sp. PMI_491]
MANERFQDYAGRAFGDASDTYELNLSEAPPQPVQSYALTESYAPQAQPVSAPYSTASRGLTASDRDPPEDTSGNWTRRQGGQNGGLRRYQTRRVKLVQGTVLSVDYPVPSAIKNSVQPKYMNEVSWSEEFSNMRYTAATCDPNDFTLKNGYDLRPRIYNRHTELFVCVTYYNEDKVLFARSYHSIMENLRDIIRSQRSTFWNKGGPAWQKVVLCLAMDGIEACDSGVLDTLATVGAYQQGIMKREVAGRETEAHIFEYTTQLSVNEKQQLIRPSDDNDQTLPPLQVIICLKAKNSGKINSNRWFLNAFGRILNPEVVVHIDTGTRIDQNSLFKLWGAFYNDKNLGGACGIIRPYLGDRNRMLLNPLVASQNFEYKVACQLERALESTTGYLSVLPGAFSAYRFRAIMGRPLEEYFQGDPTLAKLFGKKGPSMNLWRMNRYLAEDRILSFELSAKAGSKWHTQLVPSAGGETDIPVSTVDFINQRRRWLNGSLSASIYSLRMVSRLFTSGHNYFRMAVLFLQMAYNLLSFLLAWFSLAGYLLTTFIVNDITGNPPDESQAEGFPFGNATRIVNSIIQIIYLTTVAFQFVIALGGQPKSHRFQYAVSFTIFSVVQLYLMVNLIYLTKRLVDSKLDPNGGSSYNYISEYYSDVGSLTVLVTAVSVFGVYIAAGIICLDPWHLLHSWGPYLLISSSYTNILKTYAFSNMHIASWGIKSGKKEIAPPIQVPPVAKIDGGFFEEINRPQEDIDSMFELTVRRALAPQEEQPEENGYDREGAFLKLRTTLIGVYLFSNFLVCVIVMNDSFQTLWWLGDPYWHKIWFFRLWMWGNSILLLMQLVGCMVHKTLDIWRLCIYRY